MFCRNSCKYIQYKKCKAIDIIFKRGARKTVKRGQDPEELKTMPKFEFETPKKLRNRVFVWGHAATGALGDISFIDWRYDKKSLQTGRREPLQNYPAPHRLDFVNKDPNTFVRDIACGYGFTVIAARTHDTEHKLFGCGLNTDSQIGCHIGPKRKEPMILLSDWVPIKLPLSSDKVEVKKVACGRAHTVCLTTNKKCMYETILNIYITSVFC